MNSRSFGIACDGDSQPNGCLEGRSLVKRYGRRAVVDGVDVSVMPKEIVGLLGPNGAGKTTTFYMLVGFIKPNGGRVFFDGQDITHMPMYKRARLGIGYLPQEPSIFRRLTVEQNLNAVLELRGYGRRERKEIVEQLLEEFNLKELRHQYGQDLSGGEQRRVEVARAIALSPRFLLLDEPFTGVDPIAVEELQKLILKLRDKGIGILITDHNVHQTLRIIDRGYIIHKGKILTSGTAAQLYEDEIARQFYLGESFRM
ncbi:MAG: LPS export ABC transporter ATP-binding protein [Armatimonadota bacterium]|nr:LPS export ABC transporter ATP-binding protein [Armatimonadota bacterium]MCX7776507.1 LPS export ABC transporter ATP-binding protein [Armatimonadota bacterium]MDW8024304.1 LPS export ABC transporter ATP-binding protein [Armatimonadota bacterium]